MEHVHDQKLDALEDIIESMNGKPLLVAYWYQHDLICKLVQMKKDIVHKIKAVQNTEYQTLLELRYLCFKSWEQIAVDMGYELRWLYRLHHRALDAVTEISH